MGTEGSMLLETLQTDGGAAQAARAAIALLQRLYPLCRSITGNGVRQTLDILGGTLPLRRHEVPSGTPVFDWEVPPEWNVREAYVADAQGRRVIDFAAHNLHLVSYSVPVRVTLTLDELQPHLHSLPEQPQWIPYRTGYYRRQWGFCLRHAERERLQPGRYEVVVDTSLEPGHLSYAECVIAGESDDEAIVYTHTCHPSLANDNLSGIVVAATLAGALQHERPHLTWRFVFGPGTIGSLTWLSRNEQRLDHVRCGLVLGLLGDGAPLTYKRSRSGTSVTDRAAEYVLRQPGSDGARVIDFEPYGYDERQFCSPGFDLPVGRLTRSIQGAYAQYHTSADNLSLVSESQLAQSIAVAGRLIAVLDANRVPVNQSPKGEPQLGKRGLYGAVGGAGPREFEQALLWVLNQGDGRHDLLAIAGRSGLRFDTVVAATQALEQSGLVRSGPTESRPRGLVK